MEMEYLETGVDMAMAQIGVEGGVVEKFLAGLPEKALHLGIRVVLALVVLFIGLEFIKILRKLVKKSLQKANADQGVIQFLDSLIKVLLTLVLLFMIATSFGLDATSVVAVLGSVGVALSLALQGSLSNFAGGVLILLIKPFVVGDYILEGVRGHEGTVSEIQLFYTKLQTPDDKVIILPNGTLANNSIVNFTATKRRRMEIKVGISYESDIKAAKEALSRLLAEDKAVLQDRESVVFVDELGDSAVILGIRCWFSNEDYWEGKWRITENSKEVLEKAGISIPYPQMDVHMKEM